MYVVLGASGNTGHVVAQNLLASGRKVRVVGRNAAHLQFSPPKARRFSSATSPTHPLWPKLPTGGFSLRHDSTQHNQPRCPRFSGSRQRRHCAAVQNAGVKNVVSLSSVGADKASGTGPVVGLHNLEQKLNQIDTPTCYTCAPATSWKTHYRRPEPFRRPDRPLGRFVRI